MEKKNCKSCHTEFAIDAEDQGFYKRLSLPHPTHCPKCRQHRRYAWRNERTLYRRNCDLCSKNMVTIYSPDKPHKVYCNDCWWGDGWDAASYGMDYDFSRPFFEQYRELQLKVPRMALLNKRSVNSEYTNHSADNKNAFMSFSVMESENIYYSTWIMDKSRECMDCSFIYEAGERLYDVIDSRKVYGSQFCFLLKDCVNCFYSYDLHGCQNCFLSGNLRNKSYVFKNVQYSREEYLEKVKEYDLSSYKVREKLYKEYLDMMKSVIHRYNISERNVNCTGNLIFDSRNLHDSFEVVGGENGKYLCGTPHTKDCMDLYHVGFQTELAYECQGCTRLANCQFCHLCYDNMNVMYSDTCQNSQNLFGCISVKKGEHMILNKKYSKEDYEKLKEAIIKHMKSTGEYGEFFPASIAPVYYNETQGNYYMPMTKEEVLAKGWQWEDKVPGTFGKETLKEIPDNIKDVGEDIIKEILRCDGCSKNYNIVPYELSFYKKENIPIPHFCPECRYKKRFNIRLPRELHVSKCKCNMSNHDHKGSCPNEFKTPYAENIAKVFCESCYNKEVY